MAQLNVPFLFHLILVLFICGGWAPSVSGAVVIHPPVPGETPSADYEVRVNGKLVFCYTSYRFDTDSKETIRGRPVSPLSFASFDHSGSVEVEVRFLDGLRGAGIDSSRVVVRPLAHGIKPKVTKDRFTFRLRKPCQLSIEPGGSLKHPLHLFANPIEEKVPATNAPGVRYFGPGVHELNEVELQSNQTIYIAGGALVSLKPQPARELATNALHQNYGVDVWWSAGLFGSYGKTNVTIRGRGILCGRRALAEGQRGHLIRAESVTGLKIDGIILREPSVWGMYVTNCRDVHINNVKILGHYVNSDGIPIGGTSDALVENSFCHNADDAFQVKVWIPQRNVTFRNCVVWNDLGGCLGLMHEADANIDNVRYENCTVIHSTDDSSVCPIAGLKLSGAGQASRFVFENIVIEDVQGPRRAALKLINNWDDWHLDLPTKKDSPYELQNPPKRAKPSGAIHDIVFRNVRILECRNTDVVLIGEGPDSPIENITFENVVIARKRLVPNDPRFKTNQWVRNITVK